MHRSRCWITSVSLRRECRVFTMLLSLFLYLLIYLLYGFFYLSTLLSIRDFMLKAAQTKWIARFVAKTSIQDALMQFDQQLRDAAMSFQVHRRPTLLTPFV
jgi:hypothetical protein